MNAMKSSAVIVASVLVATAVATGAAFQSAAAWPPAVIRMPPQSPVRSPADEQKTIVMPPGYHVELVASEPLSRIRWPSTGTTRAGSGSSRWPAT